MNIGLLACSVINCGSLGDTSFKLTLLFENRKEKSDFFTARFNVICGNCDICVTKTINCVAVLSIIDVVLSNCVVVLTTYDTVLTPFGT